MCIYCGNPAPNPQARRPDGEVVEGVYRRYAPAGARERPLRNSIQHNGEHLRQRGRKIRYPLKGRLLFFQEREPGVRAEQSTSRTRYGQADSSITDFSQWPREKPHARTTHADTTRTTGTAGITDGSDLPRQGRDRPGRRDNSPGYTVAHGVTPMIFVFPALGTDPAGFFLLFNEL